MALPLIVLHPNPVPEVHVRAFVAPLQDGNARPDGVVAVRAPSTVFAVCVAKALLGIALAATARLGVVVEFVTVGTNHVGHEAEGAAKLETLPLPLATQLRTPPVVDESTYPLTDGLPTAES